MIIVTHRDSRWSAGFTLLELMLALAILSVVLVMIAGSFSAVIHSKIHGEARLDVDREGRAILWELANEIGGAVQTSLPIPPSNVLLIGKGQMGGGLPVDSITVSTLAAGHRRAITGMEAEWLVTYAMTPNPQVRGWYVLSRGQRSALLLSTNIAGPPPIELADNVVSLHIRYFNGLTWLESWDSTALPAPAQLPIAVSIELVLGAGGGRLVDFATQVVVPMAVPLW
ncbi:MAG TPA: prepilin-type N-terminal cleavage/methylation domain-containing protein [Candidatus Binataceae bacterium]|nr:prepilin-type N-terminal cleavage/methylation domain-containing protein [Candidatus Binataceae bacterium]